MLKILSNSFPPLFLLVLVTYSYYSYVIHFCIFFLVSLIKKIVYITIFHFLLLMSSWSFFQTMCKTHKPIPDEYRLTPNEHARLQTFSEEEANQILRKIIDLRKLEIFTSCFNGRVRYCNICMVVKPDRTHHCSTCNRCVMKMDHHCPWVYNCIGFSNYKQFLLLLLYSTMWCVFYVGTVAEYLVVIWKDVQNNLNKLFIAIGFLVVGFTSLIILILFVYHLILLHRNETTLEALQETTFRENNATFDMGKWNNFTQVFGENICCWLIPVESGNTNGHEFPLGTLIG